MAIMWQGGSRGVGEVEAASLMRPFQQAVMHVSMTLSAFTYHASSTLLSALQVRAIQRACISCG